MKESKIIYAGPGWYAPGQFGEMVEVRFVCSLDHDRDEASRQARNMGLGTPRQVVEE